MRRAGQLNKYEQTDELKEYLYQKIMERMDMTVSVSDRELMELIDEVIVKESKKRYITLPMKYRYRQELFDSFRRLDVLSEAIDDSDVTEIMVNGANQIFIEKNGRIQKFDKVFSSEEKLEDVIQQIASRVNRRVNEVTPMADARLEDGSRVNIVLPPIALDGPIVTIRRFSKEPIRMEQLIAWNSISREAADDLADLVRSGYNIFVCGGTGSGKTTFLGALAEFIPPDERVITIEDSAELKLVNVKNLVRLETRPANLEGKHEITIRQLIRNALRMRPDRIIVGEVRSEEALDMIQAMCTGHQGSMSTGHANSSQDMLSRLETMVLMGMDLPLAAIRGQIASALDIIVYLGRLRDKSRHVIEIDEIEGIKDGKIRLNKLYSWQEEGERDGKIIGKLVRTQTVLHREKLWAAGYRLSELCDGSISMDTL
ncbi:MAG TPA: CpaF family protein [Candidatus Fimimorpha faecalis]|uniref:CpaF family protein n=1 Tax=Candidatus Fimimorpha faecalis TaxID=2840824 RepID=A0A9D1JEK2_9FIRM|nr:CpaF family protein [Candidatus Fimimorpha faecalis]